MKRRVLSIFSLLLLTSSLLPPPATVLAEASEPGCPVVDWRIPDCHTDPVGEPGIGTDHSDLVGTGAYPAAFYAFDTSSSGYAHFRERVVGQPTFSNDTFKNAAWVVLLDFDSTPGYDYLIGLSGKNPEIVSLYRNRVGSRQIPFLFSPTNVDSAEDRLGSNLPASSFALGSRDDTGEYWFVEWWFPIQTLIQYLPEISSPEDFDRLIEEGHLRLYFGTAEDNNNYNKDVLTCPAPATLTVCKVVVNDDGGTANAHDWSIVIFDGDGNAVATQRPLSNEQNCVTFSLTDGAYTIVEVGPDGYAPTFSGDSTDGTIALEPGDDKSVTIINNDERDWQRPDCHEDPTDDFPGVTGLRELDLVGDSSDAAAFYDFAEDYANFRVRVVGDPLAVGSEQGLLLNACWVVVLDFDSSNGYEYLISLSGKEGEENELGEPEEAVRLFENADEGKQIPFLMDPTNTDIAEILREEFLLAESPYYSCVELDTGYWFVSWAIPMDALTTWIDEIGEASDFDELIASGDLTLYFGTSADHNNYNKDVLDCDYPATLTVCKVVINNDGGTATADDWDLIVLDNEGSEVARQSPASDADNCVSFTLSAGSYTISEEGPGGYARSRVIVPTAPSRSNPATTRELPSPTMISTPPSLYVRNSSTMMVAGRSSQIGCLFSQTARVLRLAASLPRLTMNLASVSWFPWGPTPSPRKARRATWPPSQATARTAPYPSYWETARPSRSPMTTSPEGSPSAATSTAAATADAARPASRDGKSPS
jgi:hypothetical protein